MPTALLTTIGTSPAVVLEAIEWCRGAEGPFALSPLWQDELCKVHQRFHFEPPEKVFVLGTEGSTVTPLYDAITAKDYPELIISQTKGIHDLSSMHEQRLFDEIMLNWYLDKVIKFGADNLMVCVAGGYKTMSASLQKSASLFGARCVFHVLSGPYNTGIPEAACTGPGLKNDPISGVLFPKCEQTSIAAWARAGSLFAPIVGPEPGWSSFRQLQLNPSFESTVRGSVFLLQTNPFHPAALTNNIRNTQALVQRAARAYSLVESTFAALGSWEEDSLQFLTQKVAKHLHTAWLQRIPKIELHCHLGGFATQGTQREEIIAAAEYLTHFPKEVPYPELWPEPKSPLSLGDYMRLGDGNGSGLLKDPGCLRKHCEMLYEALCNDNILYAEIRCSPQNYASNEQNRGAWQVLQDIQNSFELAMQSRKSKHLHWCQVNLLIIATRKEAGDLSDIARHLALAITAASSTPKTSDYANPICQVVGVDLAGFESRATRAEYFAKDFGLVHRCGLAVTAHAGENDDAEGIWQAVYDLHARRLGHALHLLEAPDLLRTVTERQIAVELCPYANFQIKGFQPMPDNPSNGKYPEYPFRRYLKEGVRVTVNTDNPGISRANLTENLAFLGKLDPDLTFDEIFQLQRNALEASFINPPQRKELLERMNQSIESLPADVSRRRNE